VIASGLRRLHRWLGLFAAAFALLLAVTGLLLNHSEALQLDRQRIRADWVVDLYGLTPPPLQASRAVGEHWVSLWGGQLFIDAAPLRGHAATTLVGAFAGEAAVEAPGEAAGEALLIVTDRQTLLVTPTGELIDTLAAPGPSLVMAARHHGDRIIVTTEDGRNWSTDLDATAWHSETNAAPAVAPVRQAAANTTLPPALEDRIRQWWRGEGISALQLVRDLHSGAVARAVGRLLFDLAAVALIILALTGVWLALGRPRPTHLRRPPRPDPGGRRDHDRSEPQDPNDEVAAARPTRPR